MKGLKRILVIGIASCLVMPLVGCESIATQTHPVSCKPIAPQLEWYYADDEGGVYYPKRSVDNLMIYIEQLNDCIDYYNINPG
ncbi:hypothetical protein QXB71_000638 [Vibrio cholerae]|uniref:hypothetical protein n=1 Tax=Vibrio cholerae TaxID=666 RepID=UPI000E0C5B19|nr:hypothetical protein [Vibrio cholerae]EGR2081297.1 hypothetical protein [Vibrio cholerae]EGR4433864.1 hypothetical protein [Vibrio cholerae]EJL6597952.1 hypothetical protein [Vibrio cholerae]ELJ8528656.1 hypothetical protein [Vibrio cholerae]ELO1825452.1 hypothetical protein [Vibrio cholerae]